MTYTGQDKCGNPVSASATLDVRCNNAPVVIVKDQSVSITAGAEVVLDAYSTYDYDAGGAYVCHTRSVSVRVCVRRLSM